MADGVANQGNDAFIKLFDSLDLPAWIRRVPLSTEHHFCQIRWRLDFAWPFLKLAIEVQGGFYRGPSGHSSAKGIIRDQEKLNVATIKGWTILYVPTSKLKGKKYRTEMYNLILDGFHLTRERRLIERVADHGCRDVDACCECRAGLYDANAVDGDT